MLFYSVLGKYCRTSEIPDEIVSEGNEMYVTFAADSSGNEVGFLAHYRTEYADLHAPVPGRYRYFSICKEESVSPSFQFLKIGRNFIELRLHCLTICSNKVLK